MELLIQGLLQHGEHCAADHGANEDGDEVHHRVADGGDYEDAAVGSTEGAVEGHGQGACHSGANEAGGNHANRVTSCERNGTFSDEGHTHDVVHDTSLLLTFGETVLEEGGAESDGQRRNHALLMGPPMSIAIMPATTMPMRIRAEGSMLARVSVSQVLMALTGGAMMYMEMKPMMRMPKKG